VFLNGLWTLGARPDMAIFKFIKAILADESIPVFNYGKHRRDFTYIDDIVEGVIRVFDQPAAPNPEWISHNPDSGTSKAPWRIYNIGNNKPVDLMDYIKALEKSLGKTAEKEFLPLQPGDVSDTYADVRDLVEQFDYKPSTTIEKGITNFTSWYKEYHKSGSGD
jgi:UDP-glucuronate 4-epimerase